MFEGLWLSAKCKKDFFEKQIENEYLKYVLELFTTFKDNREVLNTFHNLCLQAKDINSKGDLNGS